MTPSRRSFALAVLGLAALIATPAPTAAEPLKLRIAWSTAPSHVTPLLPELPKEVYRHWGKSYVVEPVFMQGSGAMTAGLAADEVQLTGYSYQSHALMILEAKLPITAIAGVLGSKPPYSDEGFWVKVDSGINKPADLKGRVAAVNSRGSGVDTALRKTLLDNKLEPGKDTQIVEVRFPAMLAALDSGRVDAAFLVLPFSLTADKNPKLKKLFTLRDSLGPLETVVWGVKEAFVAKNRAALVDFLEDYVRAYAWLYDPKNNAEMLKIVAKVTKQPEANFQGWIFTEKDTYRPRDGAIDVELLQKNIDDLHRLGILPGTIDAKKHTDMTLIAEAKKRLGMM
jgi:NitT/TauT family transport system substrate-binding protein